MKIQDTLVEGKTKKLYTTDQTDRLIMEFLDALPIDSSKKSTMKGKGEINAELASYFFDYLESYNVPTHYVDKIDKNSLAVKQMDMIPIKVMLWNVATDSLAKRLGLKDGTNLETPVLELYLKNSKLKDPLINDYHAYALGICERTDMNAITRISTKVNAVLKSFFSRKNLVLVNFSLEFGKSGNQVLLGDEISPDTLTIWEKLEAGKFDKKAFQIKSDTAKEIYPKIKEHLL